MITLLRAPKADFARFVEWYRTVFVTWTIDMPALNKSRALAPISIDKEGTKF